MRGNHDNPVYFDGAMLNFKRFVAVPDYSILQVCNHTILCVGGAISIDRIYRINEWNRNKYRVHSNESQENDIFLAIYIGRTKLLFMIQIRWMPSLLASWLIQLSHTYRILHIVNYSPKNNLSQWTINDPSLIEDIQFGRETMDMLLHHLKTDNHPISHWYYGHFHQSWHSAIDGILY